MSKELFQVVQQLATDDEFRAKFMADPRKRLSELGVSAELVERLVPTLMAALAAGPVVLSKIDPDLIGSPMLSWR